MKRKPVGKIIVNILVILLCCVWLVPVYMVIVNAFKSRAELYENIFASMPTYSRKHKKSHRSLFRSKWGPTLILKKSAETTVRHAPTK